MGNEVCTIRIVFPVKTTEHAIEVKKRIDEILKDVEGGQVHFGLMPAPPK